LFLLINLTMSTFLPKYVFRKNYFLLFLVILFACGKKEELVPNTYVNMYVYLTDPSCVKLNAIGGWVYAPGGVKGILVYRRSVSEFIAYERNSTYEPSKGCVIAVDTVNKSNLFVNDPCSGSKYLITDGSVYKGPASIPLKKYQTSFDGNATVHIYN
jgi:Rieske Fe-S protein